MPKLCLQLVKLPPNRQKKECKLRLIMNYDSLMLEGTQNYEKATLLQ